MKSKKPLVITALLVLLCGLAIGSWMLWTTLRTPLSVRFARDEIHRAEQFHVLMRKAEDLAARANASSLAANKFLIEWDKVYCQPKSEEFPFGADLKEKKDLDPGCVAKADPKQAVANPAPAVSPAPQATPSVAPAAAAPPALAPAPPKR